MKCVHKMDHSCHSLIEIVVLNYIVIFVFPILVFAVLNEKILTKIYEQDEQRIV